MITYIKKNQVYLLVIIPLLLSTAIQCVIINNFFIHDDITHLYHAANLNFLEFLVIPHGGHVIPFLSSIFYVFLKVFGLNSHYYFFFVLLTHLLNVALLYYIILIITENTKVALFFSTLWGISPINQGSLGWFSAFGYVIVVTFLLLLLLDIVRIKKGVVKPCPVILIKWMLFLTLSSLTFGVGMSVTLCFFIITWLLLYGVEYRLKATLFSIGMAATVPLIYLSLQHLYFIKSGISPAIRDLPYNTFNFWSLTIKMMVNLFSYGMSTFITGPYLILIPKSAFAVSYILISMVCIYLIMAFKRGQKYQRFQMLAYFFMLLIVTFFISFGRAYACNVFRCTTQEMILVAPRYFYIINILCALLLSAGYVSFTYNQKSKKSSKAFVVPVLIITIVFIPSFWTVKNVIPDTGQNVRKDFNTLISQIKNLKNENITQSNESYYFMNIYVRSTYALGHDKYYFPGTSAMFVISFPENEVYGKKIYFVEKDEKLVCKLRAKKNSRVSKLLVTEQEAKDCIINNFKF